MSGPIASIRNLYESFIGYLKTFGIVIAVIIGLMLLTLIQLAIIILGFTKKPIEFWFSTNVNILKKLAKKIHIQKKTQKTQFKYPYKMV